MKEFRELMNNIKNGKKDLKNYLSWEMKKKNQIMDS